MERPVGNTPKTQDHLPKDRIKPGGGAWTSPVLKQRGDFRNFTALARTTRGSSSPDRKKNAKIAKFFSGAKGAGTVR